MGLLTNDMTRLRDEIDALHNVHEAFISDLRQGVSDMKADFRRAHTVMARDLADDLNTFVSGLKADVSKMKGAFRNDHCEMAEKLIGDLRAFVSELRRNVSQMRSGFRNEHAEMADKLIRDLATFASDLNKTVTNLRQNLADDIAGAHQAWFGRSPAERISTQEAKPEKGKELIPDDLTIIHGIGQGMEQRLNEAGIYTYARLARSNPKDLRRILGRMGAMVNVEKWIDQARELAGSIS